MVRIAFIKKDDSRTEAEARSGETVMEVGRRLDSLLEGTCEGSIACATCHVAPSDAWFDRLPPAANAELEMLDCIPAIGRTSRLGCQIVITDDMNGLELKIL
ncbi:MAG: 2Fe-2S iron-sulfur cluster binding domain-containing protein [Pseudolabrys sp.]|nr:2Fe-2S iron-sulfur cluster binding domain-containing protein [Pseudolabrys sp.]